MNDNQIPDGGMRRILVVDDDPVNARVTACIGRIGGFDVRECHSAVDAVKIARSWKPELVLADVVMPDVDGAELCVMLKSARETRRIPVLFVSANAGGDFASLGTFCGGDDYLVKPYGSETLLRAIHRILGRGRLSACGS